MMKKLMLIGAFVLLGSIAKAQPSRIDKPTEWAPNATVLVSPNQQYRLSYQGDGNLVVYDKSNKPLWNSQTNGKTPNKLVFQGDGNLVLYGVNNSVFWASYCQNKGGKSLRLNDNGSLSVWDDNKYIWNTGTEAPLSRIDKPTEWAPNTTVLISPNQQYRLSYQGDGNLVVYDKSNKPLWNTQTNGKTPNKLVFQGDGNLVLYGVNNSVFWASYCQNKGGKSLRLNDNGSLSVWDDNKYIWNTGNEVITTTTNPIVNPNNPVVNPNNPIVNPNNPVVLNKIDQLKKKVEKSNADIANPKKNIKEGVWIERALLMMDIYESHIYKSAIGSDLATFKLLLGSRLKNSSREVDDRGFVDKLITDSANFYFVNNKLEKWEILKPVIENPLGIAMESLNKAREIDINGKKVKYINENYIRLKGLLTSEGSNCYSFKNYVAAYNSLNTAIQIGKIPYLNQRDTAIYYYSALYAQLAGKYKEAIDLYKQAIELNYALEGNAYAYIEQAYRAIGDNESGLTYLEQGFIKYPKNPTVLIALINYYINKNEDPSRVLTYIDKAIQDDPKNASLYFNKAAIYDRLGDFEKAAEIYQKSIELDPIFFDAYFNLGAIIYNKGVKYLEDANKVPAKELERYDDLIAKANREFKNALPYIVKAHELKPDDRSTIETLKNIYFRYRKESDEMNKKYLEFKDKSDQLN